MRALSTSSRAGEEFTVVRANNHYLLLRPADYYGEDLLTVPRDVELVEPAPVDAFERHEVEECSCPDCTSQDEPEDEPESDAVFRPQHYARFIIEPLTFINANKLPANIANVVKYVCRFDAKNGREDLQKARRYIDIQLECMDRDDRVAAGEDANDVWSRVL